MGTLMYMETITMASSCVACGTDLPDGAAFCWRCGPPQLAAPAPTPAATPQPQSQMNWAYQEVVGPRAFTTAAAQGLGKHIEVATTQRGRPNEVGTRLEGDAARSLGVFELVDRSEMAVGQGRVGQRPQVLGRLELGRIRRQAQQVDVRGCKGTRSLTLACQPARSKTRTICLVGLAPTWRAKAARSTSERGVLTDVGRWGRGKTVRRIGSKPPRCSSTAQSSTLACGNAVATAWRRGLSFF